MDYRRVVEDGTPAAVGKADPRPPDRQKEFKSVLNGKKPDWDSANALLNEIWQADAQSWPRRLSKPFLHSLAVRSQNAFSDLVKAGCQPDMLAFRFHRATLIEDLSKTQVYLRAEVEQLIRLTVDALDTVSDLSARRTQFDEYLLKEKLRAVEGEPGDAELTVLRMDLEDVAARHLDDYRRLLSQVDGRRQTIAGHFEIKLSQYVRQVTGTPRDRLVEDVLEDLRERSGLTVRLRGSLKKRRERWEKTLTRANQE